MNTRQLNNRKYRQRDTEAYDYGFDAAMKGPNTVNCHFSLFQNGRTEFWQRGYDDGKLTRKKSR